MARPIPAPRATAFHTGLFGKLGTGIEDAVDHQGQDEVAAAVAVRAEQPIEADLARGAEGRVDMTMRQRADDGNGIPVLGNDGAAFEQCLEPGDPLVRPVGEVQQRALLDPGLRRGRLLPASR